MSCPEYDTDEFKSYFYRDFSYLDNYVIGNFYSSGDIVFYEETLKVYKSKEDSNDALPTDDSKWDVYNEGFIGRITDIDIQKAYDQACTIFNETLFANDTELKVAYMFLSAHFVVIDNTAGGLKSSGNRVTSKSVGNVSIGYDLMSGVSSNDMFGFLSLTRYGQKYLSMIQGRNVGKMYTVEGYVNA